MTINSKERDRYQIPYPFSVYDKDGSRLKRTVCSAADTLTFSVSLPLAFAAENGKMRLYCDDSDTVQMLPMTPSGADDNKNGLQNWTLQIAAADVCSTAECCNTTFRCAADAESGLFYFRFEFDTVFGHLIYAKTPDGLEPMYKWEDHDVHAFQWTVTTASYPVPTGYAGGIMYHIFVDRFARGEHTPHPPIPRRVDAVYNEDWYTGIPQHAKRPGGAVENNEFFGGNLWGILEKLPYLQSLGVSILYLSPIFQAYSNHKYDTGDYESVDPSFGGSAAFAALLKEANRIGIRVICDGVFNHTGDNSRYFNRCGTYPEVGAYQSADSPYYNWYRFRKWPDDYDCWWGVKVLPALYSGNPDFRRYICGENGILHRWMSMGVAGWRLDVADELDDAFLYDLRSRVKKENPDAVIYGEVWEDASNKIAYDRRRRYFRGKQLDSVMNYPFRDGILSFVRDGDAYSLARAVKTILAHYPDGCTHLLMNLLGTHDTERIMTALAAKPAGDLDNDALAELHMTEAERIRGRALVKLASLLQFTLPGIPCIYYGDEIGMEGYRDPFNRRPYPWGREDTVLLAWYKQLSKLRRSIPLFADGETEILYAEHGIFDFVREKDGARVRICVNRGTQPYPIAGHYTDLLSGTEHRGCVSVQKDSGVLLKDIV